MGHISDWVLSIMAKFGYFGIVFAMFAENVFPPIPSEVIMPAAGFAVVKGDLSLIGVIIAGTLGAVLGALPLYYLGRVFSEERLISLADKYGKFVFVKADDIASANAWFDKHGKKAVFFGRMVPAVRSIISVPAGMNRMPMIPFLIFTTLGSGIWTTALTLAGYHFGQNYALIERTLAPYSTAIGVGVVILIIGLIVKRRMSAKKND